MMAAAFLALLEVESGGPATEEDRFFGILVEALFAEDRTTVTTVNVASGAALFGDGSDAAEVLQVAGAGEAFGETIVVASANRNMKCGEVIGG